MTIKGANPIILYDGVCGLCNRLVQFLLTHDREGRLRFAALQSEEDRTNPMVARSGHVAIIVPRYARPPVRHSDLGIYEYVGEHAWKNRGGRHAKHFLYTGFWS